MAWERDFMEFINDFWGCEKTPLFTLYFKVCGFEHNCIDLSLVRLQNLYDTCSGGLNYNTSERFFFLLLLLALLSSQLYVSEHRHVLVHSLKRAEVLGLLLIILWAVSIFIYKI